jgi:hypothetical protein
MNGTSIKWRRTIWEWEPKEPIVGRVKGEDEVRDGNKYSLFMCENIIMKPVKNYSKR